MLCGHLLRCIGELHVLLDVSSGDHSNQQPAGRDDGQLSLPEGQGNTARRGIFRDFSMFIAINDSITDIPKYCFFFR
jgi:hypothetical protein